MPSEGRTDEAKGRRMGRNFDPVVLNDDSEVGTYAPTAQVYVENEGKICIGTR